MDSNTINNEQPVSIENSEQETNTTETTAQAPQPIYHKQKRPALIVLSVLLGIALIASVVLFIILNKTTVDNPKETITPQPISKEKEEEQSLKTAHIQMRQEMLDGVNDSLEKYKNNTGSYPQTEKEFEQAFFPNYIKYTYDPDGQALVPTFIGACLGSGTCWGQNNEYEVKQPTELNYRVYYILNATCNNDKDTLERDLEKKHFAIYYMIDNETGYCAYKNKE